MNPTVAVFFFLPGSVGAPSGLPVHVEHTESGHRLFVITPPGALRDVLRLARLIEARHGMRRLKD